MKNHVFLGFYILINMFYFVLVCPIPAVPWKIWKIFSYDTVEMASWLDSSFR